MEKIMSKTNDTSKLDHANLENRALADSELNSVNGGSNPSLLQAAAGMVITGVAEGLVLPLIRAGWV
jgi:hypothetical protein